MTRGDPGVVGKDQVKGFGGKLETAQGKGSVMLIDSIDNRVILNDVCYASGSQDHILFLMKFRREHKADFYFIDPEIFIIDAINGFRFIGISINDILYTTIPQTQANIAITRNAVKCQRNKISDSSNSSDHESKCSASVEVLGLEESFKKRLHLSSLTPESLTCSPMDLWHLRFGHISSIILRKFE